jgi:hypothetical protein
MDLKKTESHINNLTKNLKALAEDKDFAEFLAIIHRPGWTTPAEALLVAGLLESMTAHAQHLTNLKHALLAGARAVSTK